MEDADLHNLIPQVRDTLGSLPYEYLEDHQIWAEVKRANMFVNYINESSNAKLIEKAILSLASFYTYINYSSLAEPRLGNVPHAYDPKYSVLRDIALSFLRMITSLPLNDKLVVDIDLMRRDKGVGGTIMGSALNVV